MTHWLAFRRALVALAAALLLSPAAAEERPLPLAGSAWGLVEMNGEAVPADADVFVAFREDGRAAGSGGCNRFTGSYTQGPGRLAFSPLAATRMACPRPVMARESAVFAAMERVASVARHTRTTLVLADADGRPILRFRRRDRD